MRFAETPTMEILNSSGEPEVRAGAHPDRLVQRFQFTRDENLDSPKDLVIELPAGLSGNLDAVPVCPRRVFGEFPYSYPEVCPPFSQIGVYRGGGGGGDFAIYNVEPGPNELAVFGLFQQVMPVKFVASLRPDDGGLTLRLGDGTQGQLSAGEMELWGVPADHQEETDIPRKALLSLPTRCGGSLAALVSARSWTRPTEWISASADTGHALTACDELPFAPNLEFSLGDHSADTSTGAQIVVEMPNDRDPEGRVGSMIKDISVALPPGVTLAPGGASGRTACSDAQFDASSSADPSCPPTSRIGSVELQPAGGTGLLSGSVFLGEEHPGDRFRVFLAAAGAGAQIKLTGSLHTDSDTGRLSVQLDDLPQDSIEELTMRFEGGPHSLLATPVDCGRSAASARLTPYSGTPPFAWTGSIDIAARGGGSCSGPAPFSPRFSAGSTNAGAGKPTSFTTTVRRSDGEQLPERLSITMPSGLSAAVGAVATCEDAQAQSAACPGASRIGRAMAELGPGDHPVRLDGEVYLTGPYRGARFGVALVFDPAFGPFDLGKLVVRGALRVDTETGKVTVEMDSLPTIFEGVEVRFQTIGIDLDRPGFVFNPPSCAPTTVTASLRARGGATATATSPFAVHGCVLLPFRPHFSVALSSPKELRKGGHPGLRMSMRIAAGSANVRSVDVHLPSALKIDSSAVRGLCSRRRATEGRCPRSALIGSASARTPLLQQPMDGSLYLVQPRGKGSPDIWASLNGQGLEVNLRALTRVRQGAAETSFVDLPDFPLRNLRLRLSSGPHGILKLVRSPCHTLVATTDLVGQNAATATSRTLLSKPSGCNRGRAKVKRAGTRTVSHRFGSNR
jgi:hypothetical protein